MHIGAGSVCEGCSAKYGYCRCLQGQRDGWSFLHWRIVDPHLDTIVRAGWFCSAKEAGLDLWNCRLAAMGALKA